MIFHTTNIHGVYVIEPERLADDRGFFARMWCENEFRAHGLNHRLVQCSVSFNKKRGTLRGMHYQAKPYEEAKLVRCTQGEIFDVAADVRPDSPTRGRSFTIELSAANRFALYIPEGVAHGFQTQQDDCEVSYQMSEFFQPECARGFHYADATFGIAWPLPVAMISSFDQALPPFTTPARWTADNRASERFSTATCLNDSSNLHFTKSEIRS